jgi:Spy/CpxP family protein refolding chaperone
MIDPVDGAPAPQPRQRGVLLRRTLLAGAFALTFVAGGLAVSWAPAVAMGMDHAGMGGHGDMHGMAAHVDHMLTSVDATADQKARIDAILADAHKSFAPLHERLTDTHRDLARLLTAPAIDRGALEALRAERMADLDRASRALVQGLADAADVLTPAQRAKLGALMAQHHPHP